MDCVTFVVKPLDGRHLHRCTICGKEQLFKSDDPTRVHMQCGVGDLGPVEGPGRELKLILFSLKINTEGDCGCAEMIRAMNIWGPQGCLEPEKFKLIENKLRRSAADRKWGEKFANAKTAIAIGLAFEINWLDPIPSLIHLACAKAAANPSCTTRQQCSPQ